MPTSNIFDRTAIFCKEKDSNGAVRRINRIPWDLIAFTGGGDLGAGPLVSPMPVTLSAVGILPAISNPDDPNLETYEFFDMFNDPIPNKIDEVIEIIWMESENDFNRRFKGVGFYKENEAQSAEFGFPRTEL